MDEKSFFEELDKKLKYYLEPIMDYIDTQKAIRDFNLSDQSKKQPRVESDKKMLGGYTVGKKPCKVCGGKITWDNYDPTSPDGQRYPDHLDEDGNIIPGGCPEYRG